MQPQHPVVFFDGVCNFCNYWVNFAIKRDKHQRLRFAAFQGITAGQLLPEYHIHPGALDSVVLIDKGKAYTSSSAAIRICKYLDGGWKLCYGLIIIPRFLRNPVYNFIARRRYRWYGKKDSCMIPTPDVRARFLD